MAEILNACLDTVTAGFFVRQVLVISLLSLAGYICDLCLFGELEGRRLWTALLGFPLGLALYSVGGFILLLTGIPFNPATVSVLIVVMTAAAIFAGRKKREDLLSVRTLRYLCIFLAVTVLLAVISSSGLLSITIDNDSVYYYSTYPEIIAKEGRYLKYFDTFMTDVGQTSAVLNTLPFLFGFDTTFGIQHFMNMDFLLIFACFIWESSGRSRAVTALATLFLAGSLPYIFISKWIMSNVYFMEYLCIVIFLVLKLAAQQQKLAFKDQGKGQAPSLMGCGPLLFIIMAMLSMLRVEGVVVCGVLILCISALSYDKKTLSVIFALPVFLLQTGFYAMLYLRMGVDPVYSFLDIKKALAITAAIVMLFIYLCFIREWVAGRTVLRRYYGILLISLLILGNLAELAINSERYISNLLTLYRNIRLGHGWGFFGVFMLLAAVLVLKDLIKQGFKDMIFTDLVWAAFLLAIVAACWARGGMLRMGVGDSGNRVMMESVPLTVAVLTQKCYYLFSRREDSDNGKK